MLKEYMIYWFHMVSDLLNFGVYDPVIYIVNHEKKIVYIQNAKVACSSIKASIFSVTEITDEESVHNYLQNERYYGKLPDSCKDYFIFTYVRNPFERLVSCWKNKYYTKGENIKGRKKYQTFDLYLFGYLRKNRGFRNFIVKLFFIPSFLQERHFASQFNLIYKKNKQSVNYIGKLENINKSYDKIQQRYKLEKLPVFNNSNKGDWMEYYDFFTAKLVYMKYRKEIIKFGYEKEYQNLIKFLKAQKCKKTYKKVFKK